MKTFVYTLPLCVPALEHKTYSDLDSSIFGKISPVVTVIWCLEWKLLATFKFFLNIDTFAYVANYLKLSIKFQKWL